MTSLPEPVVLDEPPGEPGALLGTAADLDGAARSLDDLVTGLRSARAPGWQGADADALTARSGRVCSVVEDVVEALRRAALRCVAHAELWAATRARIAVLRDAQEADFAHARARAAVLPGPTAPPGEGPDAVLAGLVAAEAARRSEHGALRARLAEDAELTERVLTWAAEAVGVRGGPAGEAASIASLAARLPGWGGPQLARLGRRLGEDLRRGASDPERLAEEALPAATGEAHATAVLAALGPDGLRWLLGSVASGQVPPDGAVVRLLAASFADLGRGGPAWLPDLVADAGDAAPAVVPGLAAVLAVSRRSGGRAAPDDVLVGWGRGLLEAERTTGVPSGAHLRPAGSDPSTADPLHLLVGALVRHGAPVSAAELLQRTSDWTALLSRSWDDWGASLGDLVEQAGEAPPEQARTALRSGLIAVGTGLADGHADGSAAWDELLTALAPSLTGALARHVDVLTVPLWVGATGVVDPASETALRGLARLSAADEDAFDRLVRALESSVAVRPGEIGELPDRPLPVVVLPAALLAVRHHGPRLVHALQENAEEDRAAAKAAAWDHSVGAALDLAGGRAPVIGMVIGAAEAAVTRWTGYDGHRVSRPDVGRSWSAEDAAGRVLRLVAPQAEAARERVAEEAARAFVRTGHLLGVPVPRSTPDVPLGRAVIEGALSNSISPSDLRHLTWPGRAVAGVVAGADATQD